MIIFEISDEAAMEYMRQWINQEDWDDFAIMDRYGDPELFADALVNAGAIDSKHCDPQYQEMERYIEKLANNFRKLPHSKQRKRYNEMLSDVVTTDCKDCNHVCFLADGNEIIYPEVLEKCWECDSKNIEVTRPKQRK